MQAPDWGADATPVLRDSGLATRAGLVHGFSGRLGGVSTGHYQSLNLGPRSGDDPAAVRHNRGLLLASLGIADIPVAAPRQVHSAEVSVVRASDLAPRGRVFDGDAVVTDARGIALMVLAADCLPILLHDPTRGVIGAVHAGWRGTAGAIARRAVEAMSVHFSCEPGDIRAALGPAIGRCCYEVGPEVLTAVAAVSPAPADELWEPLPAGKGRLDLLAANAAQLREAGVAAEHIGGQAACTACDVARLFSHRRDGEPTGRAAAVIAQRA